MYTFTRNLKNLRIIEKDKRGRGQIKKHHSNKFGIRKHTNEGGDSFSS